MDKNMPTLPSKHARALQRQTATALRGVANRTACIADYLATYRVDRTDPYRRTALQARAPALQPL